MFETKSKLNKKNMWVVNYIETEMTKGKLFVKKEMLPMIKYSPSGVDKEIPLYAASSIVSELSPLLLLFKSDINFRTLIIEEPEAHLHPELQQKMAKLIINLVNRDIPVWITTHSDTMLQHINNMLNLKNRDEKSALMEEFGYFKEDLLDYKDIEMYQFVSSKKGRSKLESLERTKYGFVVPTFNNALEQMVKEVYAFQED